MASPQTELVGGFCVDHVTAEMLAMFDSKSRMKVLGAAFDVAFLRQADPTGLTSLEQNLVNRIAEFSMRAVTHFENRLNQSRTANLLGVSTRPTTRPTTRPPSPPERKESFPHTPFKEKKLTPTPTSPARAYTRKERDAMFDEFWAAYPRKTGKKPSHDKFDAIIRAKPDVFADIMRGLAIDKQSDQWLRDGGQFIPHPSTYLKQERWADAIANAKPYVKANRADNLARKLLERH